MTINEKAVMERSKKDRGQKAETGSGKIRNKYGKKEQPLWVTGSAHFQH